MANNPADTSAFLHGLPLDPHYIFEEFVVGAHNRFCHAVAQAVADNLGKAYNPLFIYGPVGMGKTHLMQAIGHRVLLKEPKIKIFYGTAEQFMMDVIECLQGGKLQVFRESARSLDLLMVDDVQFLASSEATQEEFFHLFNVLHQSGKQIVMTSDRPPKMLTTLADRLRSRFEWGLAADVKSPNLESRVAILRKKEHFFEGLKLDENIRLYIAGKLKSNIRELEGFLKRVQAYSQINGQTITLPLVKDIMRELLPPEDWDEEDHAAVAATAAEPAPAVEVPAELSPAAASVKIAISPNALSIDAPPAPAPVAEPSSAPDLDKGIPVGYFYPEGHQPELHQIQQRFQDVIKKHKLKFHIDGVFEHAYTPSRDTSLEVFVEKCLENRLRIAIVLGPPPNGGWPEQEFSQSLLELMDSRSLSLQLVPWEELSKDYRYLNLALDITLVSRKEGLRT